MFQLDSDGSYDLFCYGTLMVPAILARVLDHDCAAVSFQDAMLPGYTRHCVKNEDYPAVIPSAKLAELDNDAASKRGDDDLCVRGTLVLGLTYKDMSALDIFEGTQYARAKVAVKTLGPARTVRGLTAELADPAERERAAPVDGAVGGEVEAWTYVWSDAIDGLDPQIWSFTNFLRDKAAVWANSSTEYSDVDRARALAQEPSAAEARRAVAALALDGGDGDDGDDNDDGPIAGQKQEGFDDLGKNMLKHWSFAETYVNLNHGSYGSVPKAVMAALDAVHAETEARPCLFMRRTYMPRLVGVRAELAQLIGADTDEVVLVPNTTHGINNVMTNLEWEAGDVVVMYTTTYGAIGQTVKYICDKHPGVRLEVVDVAFPCAHADVVRQTEAVLSRYNELAPLDLSGLPRAVGRNVHARVRAVVVDQIASLPGVVYPWEAIVRLCRKYGAWSIVDAAHAIGQVEVDVKRADCDFWVSRFRTDVSHRGGAVLYVPKRNQALVRTSFPTSAFYESAAYPIQGRAWTWTGQYEWSGTVDWAPFLTIPDALAFRRSIGGEHRIMRYCHDLAVRGGRRVAKRWGTRIMENAEGSLTAAMVTVELPAVPAPGDLADQLLQIKYIEDSMLARDCFAPGLFHDGKWWVRFSAQVWNDLSDFDYLASVYDDIVRGLRDGSYRQHDVRETDPVHEPADVPTTQDV
ncbi:hypothetical protein Q5752_004856 [Cryptotrichosporon argae]